MSICLLCDPKPWLQYRRGTCTILRPSFWAEYITKIVMDQVSVVRRYWSLEPCGVFRRASASYNTIGRAGSDWGSDSDFAPWCLRVRLFCPPRRQEEVLSSTSHLPQRPNSYKVTRRPNDQPD